ncbi:MAG TPA: trypsin-like serine protease [Pseudonocardiaceae bacterium]|jgi:V8-like Glu-specific endopeptidase|nr:trypsin-like serine protease [Pseudonocardiaceae bacterium]
MPWRGTVGVIAIVLLAVLTLPASVVVPDTSREAETGVRQVSQDENAIAARHWTTPTQQAATPTTTPSSGDDQPLGPGVPAVGALFTTDDDGLTGHYCTASVVDSPEGDLVLTAAHCIHDGAGGDYRDDIAFVPGYHDGQDPYGIWTPSRLVVDPRWISDSDEDLDFGFLVVHQQGSTRTVQAAAGGNRLGTNLGYDLPVRVTGYPDDTEEPTTCQTNSTRERRFQLRFDCGDFPDGTSGGPWVTDVDPATGLGVVVGVIGGYETGGDTPDVSYSSYFDDDVQHLYDTAITAGR